MVTLSGQVTVLVAIVMMVMCLCPHVMGKGKFKKGCRMIGDGGVELKSRPCPKKKFLGCTTGPISRHSRKWGVVDMYYCTPGEKRAAKMLKRACKTVTDGVEIENKQCKKKKECKIGPFNAEKNGKSVLFYMCGKA